MNQLIKLLPFFICFNAMGQKKPAAKRWKFNQVAFQTTSYGNFSGLNFVGLGISAEEYRKFSGDSTLFVKSIKGNGVRNQLYGFSMSTGFRYISGQPGSFWENAWWSVGLGYVGNIGESCSNELQSSILIDSSVDQQGRAIYIDSITSKVGEVSFATEHVRMNFSVGVAFKNSKRIQFYQGIGISAGHAMGTQLTWSNFTNIQQNWRYKDSGGVTFKDSIVYHNTDHGGYKVPRSSSFAFYLQSGIALGLGRKKRAVHHLQLFTEMRPGLEFYYLPGLRTYTSITLPFSIGLRYCVN